MFGKNVRTVTIDRSVLEAEDAARRKREVDDLTQANRRRQAAYDAQQLEAEQRRHQREVDATTAQLEKSHRQAEARQAAQWAWATRRGELRDQVAALRRDIQGCEERMLTAPMPEATAAAAERDVLAHRLTATESDFARHMASQPA